MEKEDRMKMEVVVDGVSKRYGKVEALQDVSFSVKRGELFGLIGPDSNKYSAMPKRNNQKKELRIPGLALVLTYGARMITLEEERLIQFIHLP